MSNANLTSTEVSPTGDDEFAPFEEGVTLLAQPVSGSSLSVAQERAYTQAIKAIEDGQRRGVVGLLASRTLLK